MGCQSPILKSLEKRGLNPETETLVIATLGKKKELRVAKRGVNKYPVAFRQMAVERMKNCPNVSVLAQELGVDRTVLYHWRNLSEPENGIGRTANSPIRELRKEIRDLKRVLAEKTLEVDFFKGALQKVEARRQSGSGSGETASTMRSGK
jgi:transposase